jgi:hypothetical protein
MEDNFWLDELAEKMSGLTFHAQRQYGYAEYEIIGNKWRWKSKTNAQKYPFKSGPFTIVFSVIRLGGYDGSPDPEKELGFIVEKAIKDCLSE